MTSEQREKVIWLNRAWYAEKNLKAWKEKYHRDKLIAQRISCGLASSGARSGNNATENALIRLIDTEQKTRSKLNALIKIREEITEAIQKIDDNDLQAVLVWRHLNYLTFEQTAEKMNYSVRTVKYKYKQALDKLYIVLHFPM